MKNSKIYAIGLSVLLLLGATGCTNWLDVKPESQIILEEYWQSESDVDAVLAACYRGLTEDDNIYRMMVWGELRSDNITFGGPIPIQRYNIYQLLSGNINPTNSYCSWSGFYSVINYCNTLLHYAPYVLERDENFTQDDLHHVQAEALTIRSLCYFYLVRSFKEVPWIEDASIDDTQNFNKPKATEREILDHIIADLKYAQQYARTDFGKPAYNKGRFTLDGVNSLLADVYLWDQQYDKCVEACNNVLSDKQLKLVKPELMLTSVFTNGNSSESIFELQFDDNIQANNAVYALFGSNSDPKGDFSFPATMVYDTYSTPKVVGAYSPFNYAIPSSSNLYESTNDIRQRDFLNLSASTGGQYFIFKYAGISRTTQANGQYSYRYRSTTANWIVYRLSDVMLMRAEALVQMGESNYHEAIRMVNAPYLRANELADSLYITNYPTKSEMEKLVLRERQRELMFEGKRWFDLVRVARREQSTATVNEFVEHKASTSGASLSVSSLDGLYMPISQSELKANSKLTQNPYYEVASSSSR
ncbi:MAG: RagB/SusD family nutrient uptake outer membrane protein [Bacteroidota bacterium]|nr:RagB/SusD family nutrient uptake outer membrane protein [Bacteroidota bacterium]